MPHPEIDAPKVFSQGSSHVVRVPCGQGEELRQRLECLGLQPRVRRASGREWVEVTAHPDTLHAVVDHWGVSARPATPDVPPARPSPPGRRG